MVVAAAIISAGRVLVAQRAAPAELAGRWEFPGGKVEPGEQPAAALRRECLEELGLDVVVGARLGPSVHLDRGATLVLFACTTGGEPVAREHRALRWCRADELDDIEWLGSNRPLLASVAAELPGVR